MTLFEPARSHSQLPVDASEAATGPRLGPSDQDPDAPAAPFAQRRRESGREGITRLRLVPKLERVRARCLLVPLHDEGALADTVTHLLGLEMGELDFTCEAGGGPFDLVWVLGLDARAGRRLAELRSGHPDARLIASGRQILAHEGHLRTRFGVDRLVDYPAPAVRLRRILLEELELRRESGSSR